MAYDGFREVLSSLNDVGLLSWHDQRLLFELYVLYLTGKTFSAEPPISKSAFNLLR